jgi:hypothetical protein
MYHAGSGPFVPSSDPAPLFHSSAEPLMNRRRLAALSIALVAAFGSATDAALIITLKATNQPALVDVSFSGTATATGSRTVFNQGWNFLPSPYDPFPPAISSSANNGGYRFVSGAAQLRNVTQNLSYAIDGIWMQDSTRNPLNEAFERFGILHSQQFYCSTGDVLLWTGAARISLAPAGLTFADLRPGSTGPQYGMGLFSTVQYPGQFDIVPEPNMDLAALIGVCIASSWRALRRPLAQRLAPRSSHFSASPAI